MHRFNIQAVEKWNYEKLFLSPVLKQEGIFYNKVRGKNTQSEICCTGYCKIECNIA